MIALGKIQKLKVIRKTEIGVYLNSEDTRGEDDILLPKSQVPPDTEIGHEIEVFVYKDSEDRIIATVKKPKVTIDSLAVLSVVEITRIGAFLDWGLEKDLFLPFKQQVGEVVKGKSYLVGVYIDKSNRLCATMKVYDFLSSESPYKENNKVQGTIYRITEDYGAFVAVDNKYHGLISNKEIYGNYKVGDTVEVRIKKIRPDGKLELSLRKQAFYQIEDDAQKIMNKLKSNDGKLLLNDKSSPEKIKTEFNMSKAAFKRAVGRLMKEGAVQVTDEAIMITWKMD
ncbi:MAG: hypothetical protein K0S71_2786 [Clostridia bacterium]|jgi:predicted RNA-binding protein (virulence factor B family)|nr:hypothetical protein [Clostridia bacterium]